METGFILPPAGDILCNGGYQDPVATKERRLRQGYTKCISNILADESQQLHGAKE